MAGVTDASLQYRELIQGGVRWQVCPEAEWAVRAVADQAGLREIQASPRRRIFWYEHGPLPLLIKVFEIRGFRETVKALLRQSGAHREWVRTCEAYRRRLPVARPLAFGDAWSQGRPRRAFVLYEALEGVPLSDYYSAWPDPREKRRILQAVAVAVRQAHDAGLVQTDLHAGNLLWCAGKGVFLLDLERGRLGAPLSLRQRIRNLPVLASSFQSLLSRSDRLRFWRAYVAGRARWEEATRDLWAKMHAIEVRHRWRQWSGKDARCLRNSRSFLAFKKAGYHGFCHRRYATPGLLSLLRNPNGVFDDPRCRLLKESRTTKVGLWSPPWGGPELFIKRYNYQGWLYALKGLFRPSRARRVWITTNALQMRGISTVRPIAYVERRRFRLLRESYLITEGVGGEGLLELSKRFAGSSTSFQRKRRLVGDIAGLLRRLHERGVSHRDLKGQNILVQEGVSGRCELLLVDLDGVRLGRTGWRRRVRDLARLARTFQGQSSVTRTDRARFLQAYLGRAGQSSWRKLWYRIAMTEARAPQAPPSSATS
jgi:tRNA A-37 threonylcarbamoyl transferase component Bud32